MNKELIEKIITYNYNEYGSEFGDGLVYLKQENEWLHHIIKEVREWIRIVQTDEDRKHLEPIISTDELDEILEILDKENK